MITNVGCLLRMNDSMRQEANPYPKASAQRLASALRAFLPADSVLVDDEDLRPYECDALSAYRQTPLIAVLPETIEQTQRVLRLCKERRIPVVARGAGTGLSGGALPHSEGVLLSLTKF